MIKAKLSPKEIEQAIDNLTLRQRMRLLEKLEEELFPTQFHKIVERMRAQGKPPTLKQVRIVTKKVRRQRSAPKTRRRR